MHHATEDDPQYEIKSHKTDHIAAHKGSALKKNKIENSFGFARYFSMAYHAAKAGTPFTFLGFFPLSFL